MRLIRRLISRLLIVSGILVLTGGILLGAAIPMLNSFDLSGILNLTDNLCGSGETLIEEKGASSYTPGQGNAAPVRYYCENKAGRRREVTGDVANNAFGQIGQTLSSLTANLPQGISISILAPFAGVLVRTAGMVSAPGTLAMST